METEPKPEIENLWGPWLEEMAKEWRKREAQIADRKRLQNAAPYMLEVLKIIRDDARCKMPASTWTLLKAAIAKAETETNL